jgi:hypothetical protein
MTKELTNMKDQRAIWGKRQGDEYTIGQRRERYDTCNMVGSVF